MGLGESLDNGGVRGLASGDVYAVGGDQSDAAEGCKAEKGPKGGANY
jgi:hypothetical protein